MLTSVTSNKPRRRYEAGQGSCSGGNNSVSAQINYSPPKREPNCRVCYHLKEVDKIRPAQNTAYFENHLSNYATGCPQFIQMDMAAKNKVVKDIKLCNRYFHPDVIFSKDHIKECSVKVKKNFFSCTQCRVHSWICKYHKSENQAKLDKFKREYREKS